LAPTAEKSRFWPTTAEAFGEICVAALGHCSKGGKIRMRL
jgi:hypothetical protein